MPGSAPFKMISHYEDGGMICLAWLPSGGFLLGIDQSYRYGQSVELDNDQARALARALSDGSHLCIDDLFLHVTSANRGDPYREGMEIYIEDENMGGTSFFVENNRLEYFVEVIEERLRMVPDGPEHA